MRIECQLLISPIDHKERRVPGTPPFHDAFLQPELKIPRLLFVIGGLIRTGIVKTTGLGALGEVAVDGRGVTGHPGQRETRGEAVELLFKRRAWCEGETPVIGLNLIGRVPYLDGTGQ